MTQVEAEDAPLAADSGETPAATPEKRRSTRAGEAPRRRADDRQADALKREVVGIATLAVALCMLLALASFDPTDLLPAGAAAETGRTANLIGPVGASVADILLTIFGLAAFLLPLTLGLPGAFFLLGKRVQVKTVDAVGYPILVLCGAMLAHLLMGGVLVFGHVAGGLIGSTGAEVLRSLFGPTGAYILIYAVLALTFVITTRISLVTAARKVADAQAAKRAERGVPGPMTRLGGLGRGTVDRVTAWRIARAEARKAVAEEKSEKTAKAAKPAKAPRLHGDARKAKNASLPLVVGDDEAQASESAENVVIAPKKGRSPLKMVSDAFRLGDPPAAASDGFRLNAAPPKAAAPAAPIRPAPLAAPAALRGGAPLSSRNARATEALVALPQPFHGDAFDNYDDGLENDLESVEADFEDPMDREAVTGHGDTMMSEAIGLNRPASRPPRARAEAAAAPASRLAGAAPMGPLVMPRKAAPRLEPIDIGPLLPPGEWHVPPLNLLDYNDPELVDIPPSFLRDQADRLIRALETYKIQGRVTEIHPGPVVTMFEFEPAPGVRISKIASLADDLAMAMKALKVRIVAPIPGKGVVGFEVPNEQRETVWLKEIIGDERFHSNKNMLPIALGKGIDGTPEVADLSKMPHLLVAGTTGSGKSVGVNGMITSLLYHAGPEDVRFIMVDPKMLELSIYEGIPHLLLPVVTDPKKAAAALRWACDEMDRRYELMKNAGVRDIRGFNLKIQGVVPAVEVAPEPSLEDMLAEDGELDGEAVVPVPVAARGWEAAFEDKPIKLPYIVVVIDEFADLMMVAGKEVEFCVARIAQKARAAGIHLILATQRPSTDVITGVIKANFPTRIAFQVSSAIDSRTILSCNGAESLLGKGDMLFMPPGTGRLKRIHGAFVSEEEIHKVVEFIRKQGEPQYMDESVLRTEEDGEDDENADDGDMDSMYEECVRVVFRDGRASTSHLQRRLSLGYNRAARIIDQMEKDGLVGPGDGAKPRTVQKRVMAELIARWDGDSAMVN